MNSRPFIKKLSPIAGLTIFVLVVWSQVCFAAATFNYLGQWVQMTGLTASSWSVPNNHTGYLPSGATGVILQVTSTVNASYGVRKKGSGDAFYSDGLKSSSTGIWLMTGVDSNKDFEIYTTDITNTKTYLIGYTMSGVTFKTTRADKSISVTSPSWGTVDISTDPDCGSSAIGGIFHVHNTVGSSRMFALRKNGSADNRYSDLRANTPSLGLIGLDSNKQCQMQVEDTGVKLYLVGCVTSGAVFRTDGVDKSTDTTGSYQDVDITSNIGSDDANGAIVEIHLYDQSSRGNFALRHNGSTDEIYFDVGHRFAVVGIDGADIFEQKNSSANLDLYLIGYTLADATEIKLRKFEAKAYDGVVALEWQTANEVRNLGFHIYREENREFVRLTPELIAGSALLAGSRTSLKAGQHYVWIDTSPPGTQPSDFGTFRYWLEDVDLKGKNKRHGPFYPVRGQGSLPKSPRAELLSELGSKVQQKYGEFWRIQELREELKRKNVNRYPLLGKTNINTNSDSRITNNEATALASRPKSGPRANIVVSSVDEGHGILTEGRANRVPSDKPNATPAARQKAIAAAPSVKIFVQEEGWYRVTQPQLVAAGLDPGVNPRLLQLFVDGEEQPIIVRTGRGERFGPEDSIEFYGTGLDTPSTETRVYWLVDGRKLGKRIHAFHGHGELLGPSSFPFTAERKDRIIYIAAIKNGDDGNFFGPVVAGAPVDQILQVFHPDPAPPGEAWLEVSLQGVTNGPHRVKVLVNQREAGELVFEGRSVGSAKLPIPQAVLHEGDNLVTLWAAESSPDVSLLNSIRLTYWHLYAADDDFLKFIAQGGEQLSLEGFSSPQLRIIDITDPRNLIEVMGTVRPQGSGYLFTSKVPRHGQRTLLALTQDKIKSPSAIAGNQPSGWHQENHAFDMVIISHRDFLELLKPLKELREAQGLSVALVDVEDVYDEFSFGVKTPQAVKDFFMFAKEQWSKAPRFVLLVGDASFDPRNYYGFGHFDYLPTKLIDTEYIETASDDWFVDFDGDGLPDMAIGRLPLRTAEEATIVVSKIIGYENSGGMNAALLVADKNVSSFNFEVANSKVKSLLPSNILAQEIFRGRNPEARNELLRSIDQGPLLVNYIGHGSVPFWNENLLTSEDADTLSNGFGLPFFINMTCLNGWFHDPLVEGLGEALLKAKGGGAVAVWTSSGLTEPEPQALMNQELIRLLFDGQGLTIGEAVMKAKAATYDPDVRKTWILFGDPATRLRAGY